MSRKDRSPLGLLDVIREESRRRLREAGCTEQKGYLASHYQCPDGMVRTEPDAIAWLDAKEQGGKT